MKNNFSKSRNFSTYHGRSKAIDSSFNNGIRAPSHFSKPKTKKLIVGVQWEISALNFIFPILQYKPWKSHDLQFLQPQWSPVPTATWSPVPTVTVISSSYSHMISSSYSHMISSSYSHSNPSFTEFTHRSVPLIPSQDAPSVPALSLLMRQVPPVLVIWGSPGVTGGGVGYFFLPYFQIPVSLLLGEQAFVILDLEGLRWEKWYFELIFIQDFVVIENVECPFDLNGSLNALLNELLIQAQELS